MIPQFCTEQLKSMLLLGNLTPKEKRALRFALHFLTKPKPKMRYWRTINYTDEGCYLYECLACEGTWESRTEPSMYCTYCGVEWLGPIRNNVDNDRMLGERRLAIERAIESRPPIIQEPSFWWVLQFSAGRAGWRDLYTVNPNRVNAVHMHAHLIDRRLREPNEEFRVVTRTPEQVANYGPFQEVLFDNHNLGCILLV